MTASSTAVSSQFFLASPGASIHDNAHRMVAEGMQFSWCWSAGTILLNVEVVWEMSDQTATEDNHSNGDEIWV